MILKLAFRNLLRHGKSTLLVLFFMTAVGMVFMLGNSLMVTVNQSMKKGFQEHITGEAVLMAPSTEAMSLFGAMIPAIGEFFSFPVLKQQQELEQWLDEQPWISWRTPLISGNAVLDFQGYRQPIPFFGIDQSRHFEMFSDIEIHQGDSSFIGAGALLPRSLVAHIEESSGKTIHPGDMILLSTAGDTGFSIEEVPVKGIYSYPYTNPVVDFLILLDQGTARGLLDALKSQISDTSPEEASDLLDGSLDDIFSMDFQTDSNESEDIFLSLDQMFDQEAPAPAEEGGSWHFMLVNFKGISAPKGIKLLSELPFSESIQMLSWREAAGQAASYAYFIQLFFYLGFILIMLTGVLGIVNVMLISIFRRTVEIGTIQALGGTSAFIRKLLLAEVLMLSFVGGILSLVLSSILFQLLNRMDLRIGNSVLNMVFGGKALYFPVTFSLAFINMGVSMAVGLLSGIFPLSKALSMEPVEALKGGER